MNNIYIFTEIIIILLHAIINILITYLYTKIMHIFLKDIFNLYFFLILI